MSVCLQTLQKGSQFARGHVGAPARVCASPGAAGFVNVGEFDAAFIWEDPARAFSQAQLAQGTEGLCSASTPVAV